MGPILALFERVSELFVPSQSNVQQRHERYLAEAVDMCDLEHRMRELDSGRAGPL